MTQQVAQRHVLRHAGDVIELGKTVTPVQVQNMQLLRPAGAPIPTKEMTITAAPYQPQNFQVLGHFLDTELQETMHVLGANSTDTLKENMVYNKATQMQGSRPAGTTISTQGMGNTAAPILPQQLQVLRHVSAAGLEQKLHVMGLCICFQVRRDGFHFANRDPWNLLLVTQLSYACLPI
ncbi:uncharacterized protein LOC129870774 isoform X2 [Solanum dulcamara]|uniref:uncharacterized protein LOC129870774 isoform X2 n=1 Tax=Solanum dulcamara TaxID=45834 RepID=UPI002486AB29|nr:uncharacterized protein LOC129870774 isoform X2 [Solanum dulcamara]